MGGVTEIFFRACPVSKKDSSLWMIWSKSTERYQGRPYGLPFLFHDHLYWPVSHFTALRADTWSNLRLSLIKGPSLVKSAFEKSRSVNPVIL